jgi:hypothetical protein
MAEKRRKFGPPMTGWFDPAVMAQTATMLFTANIFGRHSDTRLIEALGSQPQDSFDYSKSPGDFWIDYVADVGDGWNSTYAIADALSTENLHDTQAGQVLIFGGDQVYPYPSRDAYARRTEAPYQAAFEGRTLPDVYAIPGNHDWFDSLIAFSRTFCRPGRGFAGCKTRQTRSYFALHLPQDWWLVGIDLQLGADFDEPQLRYFREVAAQMSPSAKVILCVPEPQWIYECAYPEYEHYSARTLAYFETEVLVRKPLLTLTGDLHFYKRHTSEEGVHKVVAGGGGAFLHPTHCPPTGQLRDGFKEQAVYPDRRTSAKLSWRNLLFPFLNPKATLLPALVYALSAWFASSRLNLADIEAFPAALHSALKVAIRDPFCGLWLLLVIAALVFFTDTHSRLYRLLGGGMHAIAHLFAALALAWLSMRFTVAVLGMNYGDSLQLMLSGLLTFFGGALVGGFLIGLYLLISISLFGRHYNEAFSSLRVADYKQWLRIRIDSKGVLTAWSFAIDKVPRRWRINKVGRPAADDPAATAPREIDRFIVQPKS